MKRHYQSGFVSAAVLIGILAYLAYSFFEVYPRTRQLPPSVEARINEYLALDRWLLNSGIPVRVHRAGDLSLITQANERRIFIQSSLFRWTNEAVNYLLRWIEDGGHLFLVLDYSQTYFQSWYHGDLKLLLEEFGIEVRSGFAFAPDNYEPFFWYMERPFFDHRIFFEVSQVHDLLSLKDSSGLSRLIQVRHGKGKLTVSGQPRFLFSNSLERAPDSRLAWAIFGADTVYYGDETGWLFIRGQARVIGLLGSLFRHGNMAALLVSIFVLLAIGFWAVIPRFGLVRRDDEKPGKPLRERFLAEGRFLGKYGALSFYAQLYVKEINRRLMRKEGLSSNDEIEQWILDQGGSPELLIKALRGQMITKREFPKLQKQFINILERI